MKNAVIIIGGDHHNTLGVIRSLGEVGISPYVIVINPQNASFVLKSTYIKKGWLIKSPKTLTCFLKSTFRNETEKPVVIACSDEVASELDMNRDSLLEKFIIPCSSLGQGYLTKIMDKSKMLKLAEEKGMRIPKIWKNTEQVVFPCFVKPQVSKDGLKEDIEKILTKEQLEDYLQKPNHEKILIQQFVEKDYEYQIIGCSLNGGEIVAVPGVSIVLRCSERSNTGFLRYLPLKKFSFPYMDNCRAFLKATGYSGMFSIEFIRDKNGEDYFLEINFRNDGNAICVTAAGVNLPYIWCQYNTEKLGQEIHVNKINPIYVMPEFNDFLLVLHGKVTLWKWLKDFHKTDCFMEYSKSDKKPFFYRIGLLVKRYLHG